MPAGEHELADYISVWGRRRIILRGGNRGVAAEESGQYPRSYGDLRSGCFDCSPLGEDYVSSTS
jgi:hypothetical protein